MAPFLQLIKRIRAITQILIHIFSIYFTDLIGCQSFISHELLIVALSAVCSVRIFNFISQVDIIIQNMMHCRRLAAHFMDLIVCHLWFLFACRLLTESTLWKCNFIICWFLSKWTSRGWILPLNWFGTNFSNKARISLYNFRERIFELSFIKKIKLLIICWFLIFGCPRVLLRDNFWKFWLSHRTKYFYLEWKLCRCTSSHICWSIIIDPITVEEVFRRLWFLRHIVQMRIVWRLSRLGVIFLTNFGTLKSPYSRYIEKHAYLINADLVFLD